MCGSAIFLPHHKIKPVLIYLKDENIDVVLVTGETDIGKKNAELNAKELENRSTILAEAVMSGKLKIVTTFYHLESGEVEFLID